MVEVSIVICTRNRANQLQAALDALAGIRTEHVWEAVILDNGSTDHTEAVIASYASKDPRFHPAREEQPGLGAARDTAWRKASGKIVSFTDDDCYVAEDYVDRIVEAFGERPQAGYLGGRILLHDPSDAPVTIMTNTDPFDMPSRSFIAPGVLHGANLSFRREALEAIGGVSRDMGAGTPFPCEDVDAVASASWSGFDGGYDPRPTVSHHHGRKLADVAGLRAGYDAGRAAFYAKFIARPESRGAYFGGFIRRPLGKTVQENLASAWRVGRFGTRYLRQNGKWAAIPLFLFALGLQGTISVLRFARNRVRRLFASGASDG